MHLQFCREIVLKFCGFCKVGHQTRVILHVVELRQKTCFTRMWSTLNKKWRELIFPTYCYKIADHISIFCSNLRYSYWWLYTRLANAYPSNGSNLFCFAFYTNKPDYHPGQVKIFIFFPKSELHLCRYLLQKPIGCVVCLVVVYQRSSWETVRSVFLSRETHGNREYTASSYGGRDLQTLTAVRQRPSQND